MNGQSSSAKSASNLPGSQINVNQLGYFLDGWADLVEGMGEKANEVRDAVYQGLLERRMPEIQTYEIVGTLGLINNDRRNYTITETYPGATTTIYIGEHGKDLYVSWKTFIKLVPNWPILIGILGGSLFFGVVIGGVNDYGFSFSSFLTTFLIFLVLFGGGIALAGKIMRGNIFGFFFVEPTIFDAEDITAMSLSAHKTLLRSLDSSGIDVSKLRLKQTFKGGRRDEEI